MIRPLLIASTASLALLAACQQSEPEPVDAAPATTASPLNDAAEADPARTQPVPQTLEQMQTRAEERFARLDADQDGVVTAAELEASDGRGGRMLARADADGDGRITRAEARASTADRFRRMDANADGVIGEDERPQWGGRRGRGGPDGVPQA
ncbi:MAG: hypothetical protein EON88_17975 [Brevundimonas sp.]|nr:MAG: hypothetical protein EON88_17975 [Brevundimonas sp.]